MQIASCYMVDLHCKKLLQYSEIHLSRSWNLPNKKICREVQPLAGKNLLTTGVESMPMISLPCRNETWWVLRRAVSFAPPILGGGRFSLCRLPSCKWAVNGLLAPLSRVPLESNFTSARLTTLGKLPAKSAWPCSRLWAIRCSLVKPLYVRQ